MAKATAFGSIAAGAIALALSFSYAWAEQASQWKGTISKEGEVTIISNPKKPMTKQDILSLKEEWVLAWISTDNYFAKIGAA